MNWRRAATNAFLVLLAVWPGVQYTLTQTHDLHIWYGAGWAMYSVPKFSDDVVVLQRDGTLLPGSIAQTEQMNRAIRTMVAARRLYDPRPALTRLVADAEPGRIDGIYVRHTFHRFDGPRGRFGPEVVVWEFEIPAPTARTVPSEYEGADGPIAGTWVGRSATGEPYTVREVDGVWAVEGAPVDAALSSADACAGYPGCRPLADGRWLPLYREGDAAWIASCAKWGEDGGRRGELDESIREERSETVVWRSTAGMCWVAADAVRLELTHP